MIICTKCKKEKPETEFHKHASERNGRRSECRMCVKIYSVAYYANNKEKQCQKVKLRYKIDRENRLAYAKAYRKANRQEILARRKKWREVNKEKIRQERKIYAEANRDKMRKRDREWKKANRDKCNANHRKYVALKLGNRHEHYSEIDIYERDGWRCQLCGRKINRRLKHPHPYSKSIDHIVPLSKGGEDAPINVQAAHLRCNISKSTGNGGQLRFIG